MRKIFTLTSIIAIIGIVLLSFFISPYFWLSFILVGPIVLLGLYDMIQNKSAIVKNFPLVGRTRFAAEWLRPKVYQYFVEPDHEGRPIPRIFRNIIYQRAKQVTDTTPFGTQIDLYAEGYEWMNHSIAPIDSHTLDQDPRVLIGGPDCKQPYSCSLFNVSAMSFGSLSKNAIMALNGGAAIGNFAHNTGEGGISPYHDKFNGDLIYQIGTGYFGCRSAEGGFDDELYKERTAPENVKMIELKLSQGAKPGHGGILPAKKATPEIAKIRSIEPYKAVHSPPFHKEFSTPKGLLKFMKKLRDLSGGKPVGFKLCIGHKAEFLSICKAMIETGIKPDFISVDGGEGGTGAAPVEFSNSVGMPFKDGLAFVYNALEGFGIKEDIKLIASGKIITGFHIFRAMALGADACYSARAMMMAVGCIQALECNHNTCPTGVATQKEHLVKGLNVQDKKHRVANYHKETIESFVELMGASGIDDPDKINRSHVHKRIVMNTNMRYDEIFKYVPKGSLLKEDTIPENWKFDMSLSSAEQFILAQPLEKLHL
jgi:glutamate synthase domain-containing protein 2